MKSSISQYSQRGFFQNICKICRYDDKVCVWYKYTVSSNFFRPKSPLKFWEICGSSQHHINCFLFCRTVIEYFAKTENRREAPWDKIASVVWHCYVLSMFMSKQQILKKCLMNFHQKKFVPRSFSNRFLYQTT